MRIRSVLSALRAHDVRLHSKGVHAILKKHGAPTGQRRIGRLFCGDRYQTRGSGGSGCRGAALQRCLQRFGGRYKLARLAARRLPHPHRRPARPGVRGAVPRLGRCPRHRKHGAESRRRPGLCPGSRLGTGRGLARRLLAHAEVLARQSGMRALRLDVCVGNVPAIRLYEQCGFACAGTAEMHFCVGTVDPCRLYEKTL